MNILTINAGSSSLKFKLFRLYKNISQVIMYGQVTGINASIGTLTIYNKHNNRLLKQNYALENNHYMKALDLILNCSYMQESVFDIIINRIVHGGDIYRSIIKLDRQIITKLAQFNSYAPLHQPFNLLIAETMLMKFANIPSYGCFDTAFHQSIPLINRLYPIPWHYTEDGIKKYGFHGLSYEYINTKLVEIVGEENAKNKWIIAHLGGGSSLCALENQQSIATTMGFSTLDGLPMMTRCGELDVQIPLYLQQQYNLSPAEVLQILNNESGLYGICKSKDMQEILSSKSQQAKLAIDLFCKRVAEYIAKLIVDLNGLYGIIFTAGIGENNAEIRNRICSYLLWLSLELDDEANINNKIIISNNVSKVQVLVIKTNEELAMLSQYIKVYE